MTPLLRIRIEKLASLLLGLFVCCASEAPGQQTEALPASWSEGPSFLAGTGHAAVKDMAISQERYTGPVSFVQLTWTSVSASHLQRIHLGYRWSSSLRNYSVPASFSETSARIELLYPLGRTALFGKPFEAMAGPSLEVFVHERQGGIAGPLAQQTKSGVNLISFQIAGEASWTPLEGLRLSSGILMNLAAATGRTNLVTNDTDSKRHFLTLVDAFRLRVAPTATYRLIGGLELSAAYLFEFSRLDDNWEFLSASDNILLGLTYAL